MKGSASSRHRAYRERRRLGVFVARIEVGKQHLEELMNRHYLKPGDGGDRKAIGRAIEALVSDDLGVSRPSASPPARSVRDESASHPAVGAATSDAIPHPPQPSQEAAGQTDEPLARPPATLSRRVVSTAPMDLYWPTDGELYATYGRAALFVGALRDWRRGGWWRDRAGLEINDRGPIPEDWLPPAEAMRMRTLGDPLEALRRRRAGP